MGILGWMEPEAIQLIQGKVIQFPGQQESTIFKFIKEQLIEFTEQLEPAILQFLFKARKFRQ